MQFSKLTLAFITGFTLATSAQAGPNGPTVTGSKIVVDAAASNVNNQGVETTSKVNANAALDIKGVKIGGGGGKETKGMSGSITHGVVDIGDKAQITGGSQVMVASKLSNVQNKGGEIVQGAVRIGK